MLNIVLEGNNAAFSEHWGEEMASILRELADSLATWEGEPGSLGGKLLDHNGNVVGDFTVKS